jgi:creatinine amidohydrolase
MKPLLWAELTWEQIAAMRAEGVDMVLFPVGSTEQHGPHLPLNVDTLSAEIVAHAVSAQTGVPVLPTLPFGCALGHTRHWPGTLSLSPQTLTAVVHEVLEDVIAYGLHRVLILSGHVTNAAPLRCALEELRATHPQLQIAQKHLCEASLRIKSIYESDAEDWHANAAETALMLHLAPDLVHRDRIFDDPDRTRGLVFSYAVPQTSEYGHTGEPTKAHPKWARNCSRAWCATGHMS